MNKNKIRRAFSILELAFMFVALSIVLAALAPLISKNIKHSAKSVTKGNEFLSGEQCSTISEYCDFCTKDKQTCLDCTNKDDEDCEAEGKTFDYQKCICKLAE